MRSIWYLCRLEPVPTFTGDRWEPRPGLIAAAISDEEKEKWRQASKKLRRSLKSDPNLLKENFEPNFLVKIEEKTFYENLKQSLISQGYSARITEYENFLVSIYDLKDFDDIDLNSNDFSHLLRPERLLRWVITSISLCYRISEIALPTYEYKFYAHGVGGGPTQIGYNTEISRLVNFSLLPSKKCEINTLDNIAKLTEPYFNPICRQIDPVSVALHCFWAFLFSRFPDQAYLSLVTIFEALLSTGSNGISHQISERAAILLGSTTEDRITIYRKIKKIYSLRSEIVHGGIELKKGTKINWETNIMSASLTNISISSLTELAEYANSLICTVLGNPTIMAAMSEKKEKRNENLNNFFLNSLFFIDVNT